MTTLIEHLDFNLMTVELPESGRPSVDNILIKHVNRSLCKLLDFRFGELNNQPFVTILASEEEIKHWNARLAAWPEQQPPFNTILTSQHGKHIHTLASFSTLTKQTEIAVLIEETDHSQQGGETLQIMQRAVEQSASAVMITDAHSRIEYVNPKFCELTGYTQQELIGQSPRLFQSGATPSVVYQQMWKMLLETGEWRGEIKDRKKNGDFFWAYETISAIKNKRGEITHFLAIAEDISSRKKAESALIESEQRFRQMAKMTGEWLWEQDSAGYYIYSSTAVKDILGFVPEDIIGKHYTELLTPQDKSDLQPNTDIARAFYSLMNHYRHSDGHLVYTESTGLPIKDESGKLLKWRGVDHDITARKHFQDALVDSEKRKRLILETALNAIVTMDSYGIVTDWNRQAEKMFGWSRDEAVGQQLSELIIPQRFRNEHHQGLQRFLRSGKGKILNQLFESNAIRRDGTEFPVEISIAPLKLGNAYEFSGFIHDITARKETEKRIRQAEVELAIAQNEMKIAQQIQASLLPAAPIKNGDFEITGYCLPAAQVGGDYFDYFYRDQMNLDMVIADVSGHSIGPGLFMVETRSALRTQSNWLRTPGSTLEVLNNQLFEDLNNADYFISMFYLQYQPQNKLLLYANAGHPPPLLLGANSSQCRQLDADGLIIGVRQQVIFEEKKLTLCSGDTLLMYTDGLLEAENPAGEFFGLERLCQAFHDAVHLSPNRIIESIVQKLKQFCEKETFEDDITLLLFKRF
jgi:PAS domain S-box-containing protein